MVGMVERGNGNIPERQNGRTAERLHTRNGYIPNLPDIFTVHTDTDTDTDTNPF